MVSKPTRFRDLPPAIARGVKTFYEDDVPADSLWQWTKVPLRLLVEKVWASSQLNPDRKHFKKFSDYHRWYESEDWPPDWTKKHPESVYPIILTGPPTRPASPDDDVIDDGWHRFHWYIDRWKSDKLIPVVWGV